MARPAPSELEEDTIQVPRAVKLPVELTPPEGFDPSEPATWPAADGRLEWVRGSDRIPEYPALPGLAPNVADLFRQISAHSS